MLQTATFPSMTQVPTYILHNFKLGRAVGMPLSCVAWMLWAAYSDSGPEGSIRDQAWN